MAFQHANVDVTWFVAVRLMLSGLLLLGIAFISEGPKVFHIWRDKRSTAQILIYGLFGMLTVQYTFMVTISYGNAAVATLLQYLGLIFIIFISFSGKLQNRCEGNCIGIACINRYIFITD